MNLTKIVNYSVFNTLYNLQVLRATRRQVRYEDDDGIRRMEVWYFINIWINYDFRYLGNIGGYAQKYSYLNVTVEVATVKVNNTYVSVTQRLERNESAKEGLKKSREKSRNCSPEFVCQSVNTILVMVSIRITYWYSKVVSTCFDRRYNEKFRKFSISLFQGAGHFCALDRPGPTLQLLSSWLHNKPLDTKVPADLELAALKDRFVVEETVR